MINKKYLAAALCTLGLHMAASAGEFNVFCTYKNDNIEKCANVISDLVTDKYIAKYPANQYQIFVHSNIHNYTNGGYAAYALAGIIPRGSATFPAKYFSSTRIDGSDKTFSSVQLAEVELETYRSAVKSLMDACEISPNCDVYTRRNK
ncbi:MAG: hypothetical protein ACOYNB_03620 [Aquabacterium sp.]|uniref:hypothetical protein n=1 Tax=Aquabacterium sp. TaxID=1872578 RepID=UPI003BDDAC31